MRLSSLGCCLRLIPGSEAMPTRICNGGCCVATTATCGPENSASGGKGCGDSGTYVQNGDFWMGQYDADIMTGASTLFSNPGCTNSSVSTSGCTRCQDRGLLRTSCCCLCH